jgi:hypothetical protein
MSADYVSDLKNPLMQSVMLTGSVLEQISTVLETALREYALYSLSTGDDAWMQSATYTHKAFVPPNGFKCDNWLGPHYMNQCPKEFDEARIAKNQEARGAASGRGVCGGCGGRGDRGGRGGHGGRGGCARTGYGCGKFGSPDKNEIVRLIDGSAYAACKHCGWNTGRCSHTTGAHGVSLKSGYSASFALQTQLNKLVNKDGGDDDTPPKKKNDNVDMLTSMVEQFAAMEKNDWDPDQANFAGMMGAFVQKLLK